MVAQSTLHPFFNKDIRQLQQTELIRLAQQVTLGNHDALQQTTLTCGKKGVINSQPIVVSKMAEVRKRIRCNTEVIPKGTVEASHTTWSAAVVTIDSSACHLPAVQVEADQMQQTGKCTQHQRPHHQ